MTAESVPHKPPGIESIEQWMESAPPGDPERLLEILDSSARNFKSEWGTGTSSVVIDILQRCAFQDLARAEGHGVELRGVGPGQRLGGLRVETPPEDWVDKRVDQSFLEFRAGISFHLIAKVASDDYALLVHSAGNGIQELAGADQEKLTDAVDAAVLERGESLVFTYPKDDLQKSFDGSLEQLARADGAKKLYESDSGLHPARRASEEQAILSDPSLKNVRLVWPS